MKSKGFIKPIIAFLIFVLILCILYQRGLVGNYLVLFNKGNRIFGIENTMKVYDATHQRLLAFQSDNSPPYIPIEKYRGDDVGIYYFVPLVASTFGLKSDVAYRLLMCSFVLAGYMIAVIGINLHFRNYFIRLFSCCSLGLMALFTLFILDVYVLAYFITCFIPLLLWVWDTYKKDGKIAFPIVASILTGLFMGMANQFRNNSGTGLLIILLLYLILDTKVSFFKRFIIVIVLIASMPFCKFYLSSVGKERDQWIQATYGKSPKDDLPSHVIWHNLYIGLGFIENKYNIQWDDWSAIRKAEEINTTLNVSMNHYNKEYENTIKEEYLKIVKNDLFFVIKTFFLKFLYLLLFMIVFFNYGVFLLKRIKLNYKNYLPLIAGIVFYIIPGVLVYPLVLYFVGALNILVISELFVVNAYWQKRFFSDNKIIHL